MKQSAVNLVVPLVLFLWGPLRTDTLLPYYIPHRIRRRSQLCREVEGSILERPFSFIVPLFLNNLDLERQQLRLLLLNGSVCVLELLFQRTNSLASLLRQRL
jgi:hypothetical protein